MSIELNEPPPNSSSDNPDMITGVPGFSNGATSEPNALPKENMDIWDSTVRIKKRFDGEYALGRRIIGRDTPIDGGIYPGRHGREALVVDTEKYPEEYIKLLEEVKQEASDPETGRVKRSRVLDAVFDVVSNKMPYSQEGVSSVINQIARSQGETELRDDTKVELSNFIANRVGVCRHQALTTGILLEKLKSEGILRGDVSVERSRSWNPMKEGYDGHAWVRYKTSDGLIYILDVAQGYIGTLKDSKADIHGWDYLRPEEKRE